MHAYVSYSVYSIHTSRAQRRASWHACTRSRASEASSTYYCRALPAAPRTSSTEVRWLRRGVCGPCVFGMREGASVAPKCQNATYKPPGYTILAQSATCMWRKKVSVMTLRISSFQFCMFYLCATIILKLRKNHGLYQKFDKLSTYQLKSCEILQDLASLQPQYTVRMKYIF